MTTNGCQRLHRAVFMVLPDAHGLPRAFWILWVATFVDRIGGFVVPFLSIYLTRARGFSVQQAGIVAALYGLGSLFSGPVAGRLADRIGRKPVFVGAMTASAISLLCLAMAQSSVLIGTFVTIFGFLSNASRPATMAAVADIVAPQDRARAFALLYWVINLAFAIAPLAAGLLWKLGPAALFVGDAATTLVCVALLVRYVAESRPPAPPGEPSRTSLARPFLDRPFVTFVLLTFVGAMVFQQAFTALPLDMTAKGISPASFGALMAINGILIVVVQPILAARVRLRKPRRVIAVGTLVVGAGFGMTALAGSPSTFAASIAVWSVGEILWLPLVPAVVAALSPTDQRASYQGVSQLAWGAAGLLAPLAGTFVMAHFGSATLWSACLAGAVLAAAGHVVANRRSEFGRVPPSGKRPP